MTLSPLLSICRAAAFSAVSCVRLATGPMSLQTTCMAFHSVNRSMMHCQSLMQPECNPEVGQCTPTALCKSLTKLC